MGNLSADAKAKLGLFGSMLIFGTIGIFVRVIPLSSGVIALVRGVIGTVFLLLTVRARHMRIAWSDVRRNIVKLCVSGAFIGFNWILLFEAYRYTTVATATLCYYFAPIFVLLASPVVLGERLTPVRCVSVLAALTGMVFVSGVLRPGAGGGSSMTGVLLGLGAAALYACVVLLNKKLSDIAALDMTIVQLASAAAVLLPYVLLTERTAAAALAPGTVLLLLTVGILHTGVAYALYFGSIKRLPAQTAALFSYIDPVVAILLSALLLNERMDVFGVVGAVLVLGATLISEIADMRKRGAAGK